MDVEKHGGPRRGPVARLVGRTLLRAYGWKLAGTFPEMPRAVFIASPHTSNYDGIIMVTAAFAMGIRMSFLGKKSMFRFPLGPILRFFGGVSVDRRKSNDTVQQVADEFASRPGMYLAVAPAGTRSKRDYWKSGFYQIALKANVPLLCGTVDYVRKEAGIIGIVVPTGVLADDMDAIRAVYEGRQGRFPQLMTQIRLPDEDEALSANGTSTG